MMADGKEFKENPVQIADADENLPTETVRTGTPRKSKAKELMITEEFCVFCYGSPSSNDEDFEELLMCSECLKFAHPTCLEMPLVAVEKTKIYAWQCNDCKGCYACGKKNKEKSIILCDYCDRGFHKFCLEKKPIVLRTKSWKCPCCEEDDNVLDTDGISSEKNKADQSTQEIIVEEDEDEKTLIKFKSGKEHHSSDTRDDKGMQSNIDTGKTSPNMGTTESSKAEHTQEAAHGGSTVSIASNTVIENVKETAHQSGAINTSKLIHVCKDDPSRDSAQEGSTTRSRQIQSVKNKARGKEDANEEDKSIEKDEKKEIEDVAGVEESSVEKRNQCDVILAGKRSGRSKTLRAGKDPQEENSSTTEEAKKSDTVVEAENNPARKDKSGHFKEKVEELAKSVKNKKAYEGGEDDSRNLKQDIQNPEMQDESANRVDKELRKDIGLERRKCKGMNRTRSITAKQNWKEASDVDVRVEGVSRMKQKIEESDKTAETENNPTNTKKIKKDHTLRVPKRKQRSPEESRDNDEEETEKVGEALDFSANKKRKKEGHEEKNAEYHSVMEEKEMNESSFSRRNLRSCGKNAGEEKEGESCNKGKENTKNEDAVRKECVNAKESLMDDLGDKPAEGDELSAEGDSEKDCLSSPLNRKRPRKQYVRERCSRRLSNISGITHSELEESSAGIVEGEVVSHTVNDKDSEKRDIEVLKAKVRSNDAKGRVEGVVSKVEPQMQESVTDDEIIDVVAVNKNVKEEDQPKAVSGDIKKYEDTIGNNENVDKHKNAVETELGQRQNEENTDEQPVKRKRGRPRKLPTSGKKESTPKREELRKTSSSVTIKDPDDVEVCEGDSNTSRVLRKTSREPAITPTTARSILAAQTVQVYQTKADYTPDKNNSNKASKRTPLSKPAKSPRVTPTRSNKLTPKTTPATPKRFDASGKLSSRERSEKGGSGVKFSGIKKSQEKKSASKLSGQKSSEKRKPGRPPGAKSIEKNNSSIGISKRKLSFDEKQKDLKKMRRSINNKDAKPNQRSRGRTKAAKSDEDVESVASQGSSDFESIVSAADIEMFKEAQEKVNLKMDTVNDNAMEQGIRKVEFGDYEIDTWYSSPYPSEYKILGKVFVCEYCLKYTKSATILRRHMAKCLWRHPPGDEIYRKGNISVFEVDGAKSQAYCQNLCLFAKLFLDHKTLYYEVEPFLFYVMTVADSSGCHMAGYFSKEKVSFLNYNVSCILVLPHCMQKGYGKVLIDFSYLLSRVEGKIGSPERPLSDLGLISYRSYWKDVLLRYLNTFPDAQVSIKEMSQKTSVMSNDLISTMQYLGMLKYWKGKHMITIQQEMIDIYEKKSKARDKIKMDIDESCLEWTPKDYGQAKGRAKIP